MHHELISLREDGSATLEALVLDPAISFRKYKTRPAMIVCPGGAYLTLATKEGEAVAARWLGWGYDVFILRYTHYFEKRPGEMGPEPVVNPASHVPEQLVDLMRAMAYVRRHAQAWDIDASRVYAMGFSAGGHLVGSLAEHFDDADLLMRAGATAEEVRPTGVVMGYPMISDRPLCERPFEAYPEQMRPTVAYIKRAVFGTDAPSAEQRAFVDLVAGVRPDMPRVFVWHTTEDTVVDPAETIAFAGALYAAGVPCELHLFQTGPHGTSLCDATSASTAEDVIPQDAAWVPACRMWLDLDISHNAYCHE